MKAICMIILSFYAIVLFLISLKLREQGKNNDVIILLLGLCAIAACMIGALE